MLHLVEKSELEIGYVRLTDAAPLIVALELGFFAEQGLSVTLKQEVSWANVRDKLVTGNLDAAQLLATLPAMTTLGASGLRAPLLTGLVLSNNGNAITLSTRLWGEAQALMQTEPDGGTLPEALKRLIATGRYPLTFATVHAFSTHTVLLRRWLESAGIQPDLDVKTIIVPPSQMVDSLQSGIIDGYCVGEPWNTIAVHKGAGIIAALGTSIWPNAPEKVLAVSESWHSQHPLTHNQIRVATLRACAWLAQPRNRIRAAQLLAKPEYLNVPTSQILPSLTGQLPCEAPRPGELQPDFHSFYGKHVNCPTPDRAERLIHECVKMLGKPLDPDRLRHIARRSWRPDLYRMSLDSLHTTFRVQPMRQP